MPDSGLSGWLLDPQYATWLWEETLSRCDDQLETRTSHCAVATNTCHSTLLEHPDSATQLLRSTT